MIVSRIAVLWGRSDCLGLLFYGGRGSDCVKDCCSMEAGGVIVLRIVVLWRQGK